MTEKAFQKKYNIISYEDYIFISDENVDVVYKKRKVWLSDTDFITVYFLNDYIKIVFTLKHFFAALQVTCCYSHGDSPEQIFSCTLNDVEIRDDVYSFDNFNKIISNNLNNKLFYFKIHKYNQKFKDDSFDNINENWDYILNYVNVTVISPYYEDHYLLLKEHDRLEKISKGGYESD